jgi:hypothetical protein
MVFSVVRSLLVIRIYSNETNSNKTYHRRYPTMKQRRLLSVIGLLLILAMLMLLLTACNPRIQRAAENTWDEAQRNLQREWERTQQEQQRGGATGGLLCPDVGAVLLLPIAIGVWKVSSVVSRGRR